MVSPAAVFYDVTLKAVEDGHMVFDMPGGAGELGLPGTPTAYVLAMVGQVGVVQAADELGHHWRFTPYQDQSLRRMPELDTGHHAGWWCVARPEGFTVRRPLIPGPGGAFVRDRTSTATVRVPPEFDRLCRDYGLSPWEMLEGFMADAAGIRNEAAAPREDGFSSHGSDERGMAEAYLERAHAHRRDGHDHEDEM